ncbi:DNA polymerase III subunit delta' [Chlamydia pneumoniae]|uniref:DNA Polymerase III Gamma and Tau n=1 Tax=Chlamydia pneumoniae TaxID=83558 RepID=Q9Z8R6_CHLPN|nr:DNA polymerase III subunit delta' [Chlamydia pneumoniae]AAD18421.1 DNA Polymerase III Gamma and Tau [Chlamydia pneumoniae CWL029]AAF38317.1 DNA polymerase III, tau subunit, putative [Chlamydia pneumoniae AR39]CRI32772.1 DNA Polymerase III Gamma and Tau [Chlamydia pneumoniae]CRI35635.1 DNA Polymerase III Gamma and Tau [Chlamydia pneumoniae]CRI36762.1 DNA Polymerase III Gamma and Tau [Chlamydia pneumoniae]
MHLEEENQGWEALLRKVYHQEVPPAILLHGFTLPVLQDKAEQLASEILLSSSPGSEHKVSQKIHPDIYQFFPEGKGRLHSIDLPRGIKKQIYISPFEANYKIYIIHEADRMTLAAISAFLKVFEEPPKHAVIILTTAKVQRLPKTIISRSLSIFIERGEKILCSKETFSYLFRYAQCEIPVTEVSQIIKESSETDKQVLRDKVQRFMEVLLELYRDRYTLNLGLKASALNYPEHVKEILQLPLLPLDKVLLIVESACRSLNNSSSAASVLEWVAIQLVSLQYKEKELVSVSPGQDLSN